MKLFGFVLSNPHPRILKEKKMKILPGYAATGIVALLSLLAVGIAMASDSPYAGEETREVKALSPEKTHGLLTGEGLGYAKAAELNQYPGPRHVLDLASDLKLTPKQKKEIEAVFTHMKQSAMALGKKIVEQERELDRLFASRAITKNTLESLTLEIGRMEGQLRAIHLEAHLQTTALRSSEQVAGYDRLRGYHAHEEGQHGMEHDPARMHQGPYPGHEAMHGGKARGK